MKTNDIIDIFFAYTEKAGGKIGPILVIKMDQKQAWILKITSQYQRKSPEMRKYYFPIFNWKKYGLSKPSYVDTKNYLIVNLNDLNVVHYSGHFSVEDLINLNKFITRGANSPR